jgi:YidC/Oxa1 family membrane protein insertase
MNPFDIINVPLGILMNFLYGLFNNYAVAILFFALAIKIIMLPLGIKQQQSQIKMAKIRPKEQAIRGKYAGRTDSATQQKMNAEVMDMYKAENHSPMSGCLPLLVQMPVLFALYNIIRNPLTYISRFSPELMDSIKEAIYNSAYKLDFSFTDALKNMDKIADFKSRLQQIDIIEIFNNPTWLAEIKNAVGAGFPAEFKNIDFGFLGQTLTSTPAQMGLSILLLIPVLNFAASFLQMRLQKIINGKTMATEAANNSGMKVMEYTMPLLIVYMSYTMNAALGLYWIFQSVLGIGQTLILSKLYPIPQISEEEFELARQQYGTASSSKKKKKKPVVNEIEGAVDDGKNLEESENSEDSDDGGDSDGGKYTSKTIPQGINQNAKNNYQKTGKKYTIKKRKK